VPVLVLGTAGSAGCEKGVSPVLRDDVVVATVRASDWKEAATAVVENREWVLARVGRELTGRAAHDPEGTARLRARQTSWWRGTWDVDLEGMRMQVEPASRWRGTHRYLVDGRVAAESGSTGGWWSRPTLRADCALPLDQQVFLLWLELVLRGRDSAVVGDGGDDGGGGGD
jgi:hypothetical protein